MKKTIFALAVSVLFLGSIAKAEPLPEGYWTDLLHLGSDMQQRISGRQPDTDLLNGEATIMPYPGLEVAGIPGASEEPMVWTALHDDDGLWETNPNLDDYTKYWHIYVISPDERQVRLRFRHDDDLYVWINGTRVIKTNDWDGGNEGTQDTTFVAGLNSIMIKLGEGGGGDNMAIRVTDLNDQPFTDLTYSLIPGTTISKFAVTDATSGSALYTDDATVNVEFNVSGGTPVGYMVTETHDEPAAASTNWSPDLTQYTITSLTEGEVGTLYGWVKDDQENVVGAQAQILLNTGALNATTPTITVDTATQVTVEWFTDTAAYAKVDYKTAGATDYQTTGWSSEPSTVHSFVIDGFVPGTVYSFVYHTDEETTPEEIYAHVIDPAPLTDGTISVEPYFNAAVVSWQTDSEGYGKVGFGVNPPDPTTGYENETGWGSLALGHSRIVAGLQPGTTYHFAVKANGGDWSADGTFTTRTADVVDTFDSGVDLNQWHKLAWRGHQVAPYHKILSDNGKMLLDHACDGIIAERDQWFKLGTEPAELMVQDSGFVAPYNFGGALVTFLDGAGRGLVAWVRIFHNEDNPFHVTRFETQQELADQFLSGDAAQPNNAFLTERDLWTGSSVPGYTDGLEQPAAGENLYYRFFVTDTQFRFVAVRLLDSGDFVTVMDSGMIDHGMNLQGGRFGVGSYNSTGDGEVKAWFDNFYADGEAYNPPIVTDFSLVGADTQSEEVTADTIIQVNSFVSTDVDGTIAGYIINTSSEAPAPTDPNWSPVFPSFAFVPDGTPEGDITFYGWTIDNDGNVSLQPGIHTIYYQTAPLNVTDGPTVVDLTYVQATISWTTDTPVKSQIQWGETANCEWFTPWEAEATTDHSVTFKIPFKPDVTYTYRLINGSTASPDYTFTSLSWGGDVIRTIYVDVNTSVATDQQDGTEAAPYSTIMGAIASIGDVSAETGNEVDVVVAPGTYSENLVIGGNADLGLTLGDKWLRVTATGGRDNTIIECDGSKKTYQTCNNMILDGFTFNLNGTVHGDISTGTLWSQNAVLNCRFQKFGSAGGMFLWGTHGALISNTIFKMTQTFQSALRFNDRPTDFVIEGCTFLNGGRAADYHAHWNSVGYVWFRNNLIYNVDGIRLKDRAITGFHVYNNIFVNKVAIAEVDSTDLQFYNNTLINSNIQSASMTKYVFNNLIVTTGLSSWNGGATQYQLADTDSPIVTATGNNFIAPTLDSVSGMFVSTDFFVMQENPDNPGEFIQTDQVNPDFAKLDTAYAGAEQAVGAGLAEFEGVGAPAAGIYGTEHGNSVSIGAVAAESKMWPIEGDANMDCKVNIIDLIFVRNRLNKDVNTGDNWQADVNGDGKVNIIDLIYVRNRLNNKCE